MWEYVVISKESPIEGFQKKLNQWKHQYQIQLTGVTFHADGTVSALVARKASEKK